MKIERKEKVIEILKIKNDITTNEIADELGVSRATINRDLNKLKEEKRIEYKGSPRKGKWIVKEK